MAEEDVDGRPRVAQRTDGGEDTADQGTRDVVHRSKFSGAKHAASEWVALG